MGGIIYRNFCPFDKKLFFITDTMYLFLSTRTKTNISATRTFQCCVVMHPPSCCHQKKKTSLKYHTCASKCSTAAVAAAICFSLAWNWRIQHLGSACEAHTNACVIASTRNPSRNSLTNRHRQAERMHWTREEDCPSIYMCSVFTYSDVIEFVNTSVLFLVFYSIF